jgi:hypothetical protein
MSGTGRQNLIVNERGVDVHWYADGLVRHGKMHDGWATTQNYVEEEFNFTPTSVANAYGTTTIFELDKRGDKWIGIPYLIWTRSAGNSADIANGACFSDYEACNSIAQMRIIYNNKEVFRISGERMYREAVSLKHEEDFGRFQELTLGGLSLAERQVAFQEQKTLVLPLFLPWRLLKKSITAIGLPNKVRIEIDFQYYNKCARFPPGSAATWSLVAPTLSNIIYRQRFVHFKEETRNNAFLRTKQPTPIAHKVVQIEAQYQELISSGTTSFVLPLRNIKNNVYTMRVLLRANNDLYVDNQREFHQYYLPYSVYLQDQGTPITNTYYPWKINQIDNIGLMHPASQPLVPWVEINFCNFEWVEASEDDCYGGRTIGKYNNPELVINFNSGITTIEKWDNYPYFPNLNAINSSGTASPFDIQLDVEALIHQVELEKEGDFRKYLL